MHTTSQRIQLQRSYQSFLQPYQPFFQFALTLTLKQRAKVKTKRVDGSDEYFERWVGLSDETLDSTIKRFNARLTHALYGNQAKHKNKRDWARPLLITATEGKCSTKRTHLHCALGNVPQHCMPRINQIVALAWSECDFGYKEIDVQVIYSAAGWRDYMTKEIGYVNNDALDITHAFIPQIIQQSICTESRLQTD